jgi:hypothetical protein
LNSGSIISIGSSTVQTFTSGVARRLSVEYSVVVLPEPVGPVTSTMPCGRLTICVPAFGLVVAEAERSIGFSAVSGSKMRITHFSPKAVGMVDRRISTSRPPGAGLDAAVLRAPFSATSMRPSSLMRLTTAVITGVGSSNTLCSTPSMRKRILLTSRRGSR